MDKTTLIHTVDVPLIFPVSVAGADGKEAQRPILTMRRPKVRHAKRLAALIGQDVVSTLMASAGDAPMAQLQDVDGRALVKDVLGKLLQRDALEELTAILADMCGEKPSVVDELDLVDLVEVGGAFLRFFPALRSAASGALSKT